MKLCAGKSLAAEYWAICLKKRWIFCVKSLALGPPICYNLAYERHSACQIKKIRAFQWFQIVKSRWFGKLDILSPVNAAQVSVSFLLVELKAALKQSRRI